MVGLRVYLPQPVERELEEQFVRDFVTGVDKTRGQLRGLDQHLERIRYRADQFEFPTVKEVRDRYRAAAVAIRSGLKLNDSPASERPASLFFEMAITKMPPFDAQGRGTPNAHICMAVIDHARARGEVAVLVTGEPTSPVEWTIDARVRVTVRDKGHC